MGLNNRALVTPDWTGAGTLLLHIDPTVWAPPTQVLELDGLRFAPQEELHLTVMGTSLGRELRAASGDRGEHLRDAIAAQCWNFRRSNRTLLLRKAFIEDGHAAIAHSIVELIDLPAMAPFHRDLWRMLGRQLPLPPPHVTLYTHGRAQGIGVSSGRQLRAFTVRGVGTLR